MIGLTPLYVPLRFVLCCDHLLGICTARQLSDASMFGSKEEENEETNSHPLWLRVSSSDSAFLINSAVSLGAMTGDFSASSSVSSSHLPHLAPSQEHFQCLISPS